VRCGLVVVLLLVTLEFPNSKLFHQFFGTGTTVASRKQCEIGRAFLAGVELAEPPVIALPLLSADVPGESLSRICRGDVALGDERAPEAVVFGFGEAGNEARRAGGSRERTMSVMGVGAARGPWNSIMLGTAVILEERDRAGATGDFF